MRIAAVQLDIAWEDKPANHRRVETLLDAADLPAGAFVVLPELGDTGFSFDLDVIVDDRTLPWATEVARTRGIWLQAGYAIRGPDGRGRNVAVILDPTGAVVGSYAKVHPFSYGREIEHFTGGDDLLVARCGGGDAGSDTDTNTAAGSAAGAAVTPLICYDLRFPELWRPAALAGAEVFTLGASWPSARQDHWRALLVARAIENQAFVVGVNRVGTDPHLAYAGGSIMITPMGEVVAEAGTEETVISADVDLAAIRAWRDTFPALRDVRKDLVGTMTVRWADGASPDPTHAPTPKRR